MKKLFALLLVLCLILSLAACDKKNNPAATTAAPTTAAPQTTAAPATTAAPETTAAPAYELEALTVVDNDEVTIKITGMENDEFWGPTLNVELENKTDMKLSFSMDEATVNGVNYSPFFSAELPAGSKDKETISFTDDKLNELLGDFTDIWLQFRVREAGNWEADDLILQEAQIYPFGQEAAARFVYTPDEDDKVLVDNDDFTVILTDFNQDDFWAYTIGVFVENKTDKNLTFTTDDVTVNGYVCDPYWSARLSPHSMSFNEMIWTEDDFTENAITAVEELEQVLRVYDYDTWLDGDLLKANVLLNMVSGDFQVDFEETKPTPSNPDRADIPQGTDISPVVGNWLYRMNFMDAMTASGQVDELEESMGEDFLQVLQGLDLVLTMDLNDDGRFLLGYDRDSALAAIEGMLDGMMELIPAMMAKAYGMTPEELTELLEKQGSSMDDLLAEMRESMDPEEMITELEESSAEGSFAYEDGKLYLAPDEGGVSILSVELEDDELRIVEVAEGDDTFEGMESLYPMVFTKE